VLQLQALWARLIKDAMLFKGVERSTDMELEDAVQELLSNTTTGWDSKVYGACNYMIGYVNAGFMMRFYAIK
jgi:hypothetical protein